MVLRFLVKGDKDYFEATCLELSLSSRGKTFDECLNRMQEAVTSYKQVVEAGPGKRYSTRPVRYYWLYRIIFEMLHWCINRGPKTFAKFVPVRDTVVLGV